MERTISRHLGKVISHIELRDNALAIRFTDGKGLNIFDCACWSSEERYMDTDDDLSEVIGGVLYGIEIREAPCEDVWVHEVQFLVVKTSKGEVVLQNHNDHNGYYGGFDVVAREVN